MNMFRAATPIGLALVAALAGAPANAITIEFDYSYDTRGFFTDMTTGAPLTERRALLESAAGFYSGFTDQLSAITPQSGDSWSATIVHPSLGGPQVTLTDIDIPANTVRLYVGGSPSAPGVLGFAGSGSGLTATGSDNFIDSVFHRGQGNTLGENAVDVAPWGGYIWFNANNDWHFGEDADGLSAGKPDFLTTAIHEIAHVLGFGDADSWYAQIDNGLFTGSASTAVFGAPVPLDQYGAHWAEGTMSEYDGVAQETLMDPSTPRGTRQLMTVLDYAGLADIGWEVKPVPLPAGAWLFISALLAVGFTARQQRRGISTPTTGAA